MPDFNSRGTKLICEFGHRKADLNKEKVMLFLFKFSHSLLQLSMYLVCRMSENFVYLIKSAVKVCVQCTMQLN